MKALVINLDSAIERMAFQKQQLQSLNIDYERLPAYKIEDDKDPVYKKMCNTWQRPMSVSEVSCFFSHKNAWDKIIEQNKPMLILEDDAMLALNVPCILKEISAFKKIDYINLEDRKSRKKLLDKTSIKDFCHSSLIRLYQGRSGAAGYVLWPSGAKKLLDTANQRIGIADKFINEHYSLSAFQVEPAAIIQLDQCHLHGIEAPIKINTSISKETNSSIIKNGWGFRIKRALGETKIGLNYIRHFGHAKRRKIKISSSFDKTL